MWNYGRDDEPGDVGRAEYDKWDRLVSQAEAKVDPSRNLAVSAVL